MKKMIHWEILWNMYGNTDYPISRNSGIQFNFRGTEPMYAPMQLYRCSAEESFSGDKRIDAQYP